MAAQPVLLTTIAIGLLAAFVAGYVARRIGLPPIVGYLVAGMAIGPFTPGVVADVGVATELAEVGVILLMFGVGLHFSLSDLWSVRAIAMPGALVQIVVSTLLGTLFGVALGWGIAAGIVFGLGISVASTVVLLRALTERRELDTAQGRIAVGWLIVEDLLTILALVLLPTVAALVADGVTVGQALGDMVLAVAKAAVLVALMLAVGSRVLPRVLLAVARDGSRELFTLAVLATSIGIAFVSYAVFGVSLALGAFLAGVVLSESELSHQAAEEAIPLRDAFAVLFFVSVGMLVDPEVLLARPAEVAAVVAMIVGGKFVSKLAFAIIAGYPSRVAVTVAAGLAQVGEFTFILAALATQLGILPPDGFQLAVAGAVLSITVNPLVFRFSDRLEPVLRESRLVRRIRAGRSRDLDRLSGPVPEIGARRHAILVGYGRVGSLIGHALQRRGFAYVVIEQDRRLVERLRAGGINALYGDASDPAILERAGLAGAIVLVIAVSDEASSTVVLERARQGAPRLDIVVRTHAERTAARLNGQARVWPIVGERELGVQMARTALRRFGVSGAEAEAIAQGLRSGPPAPPPPGPPTSSLPRLRIRERLRALLRRGAARRA